MKASITALIFAAAAGTVTAHPSGIHKHAHLHRSVHDHESDVVARDFVMAKRPPPPAPTTTSSAPPPPPPTTSSKTTSSSSSHAPPPPPPPPTSTHKSSSAYKPPPSSSSSSSSGSSSASSSGGSSGGSSGSPKAFCGGKNKRATLGQIAYAGNTGGGSGCNLMTVPAGDANSYDYTATFTNKQSSSVECFCWNKIGPDGGINGFFKGNQAVTFQIAPGASAVLAADKNSQGGCSCAPGGPPLTMVGEFAGTWLEFDFGNESNNHWSGADASCLVAASAGLTIPALSVCSNGQCSTINHGGTGKNAYLGGMEAEDGVGLNIPPGKAHLSVTVG